MHMYICICIYIYICICKCICICICVYIYIEREREISFDAGGRRVVRRGALQHHLPLPGQRRLHRRREYACHMGSLLCSRDGIM